MLFLENAFVVVSFTCKNLLFTCSYTEIYTYVLVFSMHVNLFFDLNMHSGLREVNRETGVKDYWLKKGDKQRRR